MPIGRKNMVAHNPCQPCGGIPGQRRSGGTDGRGLVPPKAIEESTVLRPVDCPDDALIIECDSLTSRREASVGVRFPCTPRFGCGYCTVSACIACHISKHAHVLETQTNLPLFRSVMPRQAGALHGQQLPRFTLLTESLVSITPFRTRTYLEHDAVFSNSLVLGAQRRLSECNESSH